MCLPPTHDLPSLPFPAMPVSLNNILVSTLSQHFGGRRWRCHSVGMPFCSIWSIPCLKKTVLFILPSPSILWSVKERHAKYSLAYDFSVSSHVSFLISPLYALQEKGTGGTVLFALWAFFLTLLFLLSLSGRHFFSHLSLIFLPLSSLPAMAFDMCGTVLGGGISSTCRERLACHLNLPG